MVGVSVIAWVRSLSREPLSVDLSERIGESGHANEVFQTYRYYSTVTIGTFDCTGIEGGARGSIEAHCLGTERIAGFVPEAEPRSIWPEPG